MSSMDSGSSPSVAVVDEQKEKSAASSVAFSTPQIQPPPITVMMQQAIAIQQFQFQQALLMQQVMASQQAAARAATLKSAADMAAARAAEISKQLKETDAAEENKKAPPPSPSRSSPRSSSHSRSRSRSRSATRYRRDRSFSVSPIRYRRDRYSPARYRDYYGYRSRSRYRGNYREGHGDYFRSYYQREWDQGRDREYISHRSRRSRSRVRRRSKTHSPSPKYLRDHNQSPKHQKERRSVGRRSRRSRSSEAKWGPSRRSLSVSTESEGARTEGKAVCKGSLVLKSKDGDDSDHRDVQSDSMDTQHPSSRRSSRHFIKAARKAIVNDNEQSQISDSPVRSLSVSLEPPSRKTGKKHYDEGVDSTRISTKVGHHRDIVNIAADELQPGVKDQVLSGVQLQSKAEENGVLIAVTNEHKKRNMSLNFSKQHLEPAEWLELVNVREPTDKLEPSDEEIQDEELDDWRDDIKMFAKEKAMHKESQKEAVEKGNKFIMEDLQQHTNNSMDEVNGNGKEFKELSSDGIEACQDVHHEGDLDIRAFSNVEQYPQKNRYKINNLGDSSIKHAPYSESKFVDLVDKVNMDELKENTYVSCNRDGGIKGGSSQASDYEDKEVDLVYEGPKVAANEYIHSRQQFSPSKFVVNKEVMDAEYKQDYFHDTYSTVQYKTSIGRESPKMQSKHVINMADDEHLSHKRRGKERAAVKEERNRDDNKHEKHKDKHKKHRRKHRREASAEDDDDDDDDGIIDDDDSSMDGEGQRGKKHKRRKHRRDDKERRGRKKRKHRQRAKAFSCSRSQSLALDVKDKVEACISRSHRKSSSRYKKWLKETSKSPS